MLSVLRLTSVLKKLQLNDFTKFIIGRITESERVTVLEIAQSNRNCHRQQQRQRKFCSSSSSDSNLHKKKTASAALASGGGVSFGHCSTLTDLATSAHHQKVVIREQVEIASNCLDCGECEQVKNMSTQDSVHSQATEKKAAAASSSTNGELCQEPSSPADMIKFLELVGSLKHIKRTGWVLRNVDDCESISGHMYRMGMMTYLLDDKEGLNRIKCLELAMVHDLAECVVGDLTPFCGVSKEEKKLRELKAMEEICKLIEPYGRKILELFQEYEAAESPESKFVKDLDRLDMVLQAFEYEKRDNCVTKHQEFFDSTNGKFGHPFVRRLIDEINSQRKELAVEKTKQEAVGSSSSKLSALQQNGYANNCHHADDSQNASIDTGSDMAGEKKVYTS